MVTMEVISQEITYESLYKLLPLAPIINGHDSDSELLCLFICAFCLCFVHYMHIRHLSSLPIFLL